MPFYAVNLERQQSATVYVEADSMDEAMEAAEALVEDRDWDDVWSHPDIDVNELSGEPAGARYWSGGEGGDWVDPGSSSPDGGES